MFFHSILTHVDDSMINELYKEFTISTVAYFPFYIREPIFSNNSLQLVLILDASKDFKILELLDIF